MKYLWPTLPCNIDVGSITSTHSEGGGIQRNLQREPKVTLRAVLD